MTKLFFPAVCCICLLLLPGIMVKNSAAGDPAGTNLSGDSGTVVSTDAPYEPSAGEVADPLSGWNRLMFSFNNTFYFYLLKPAAQGYKAVVPEPARDSVKNFFHNLLGPLRFVNCMLQGKGEKAAVEAARFLSNTTFGILGLFDPAKHDKGLVPGNEDFGQTLGVYGLENGFYIVWPFLGPSSLRDSLGLVGDLFLRPVSYINPFPSFLAVRSLEAVSKTSYRIGEYEALQEAAFDPYVALRQAYISSRDKEIGH